MAFTLGFHLDELTQGVTVDSSGNVVDVDSVDVIFNDAMPLMATTAWLTGHAQS